MLEKVVGNWPVSSQNPPKSAKFWEAMKFLSSVALFLASSTRMKLDLIISFRSISFVAL